MPAWSAGIRIRRDASGDIQVDLGSGNPCRNDDTEWTQTPKTPRDLACYDKQVRLCFG